MRVTLGRYGLQARLREGLVLRFGDGQRLEAKWLAARAVMRDPGAAAATYIDLRIPARPAAGGLTEAQGGAPASLTAVAAADAAAVAAGMPASAAGVRRRRRRRRTGPGRDPDTRSRCNRPCRDDRSLTSPSTNDQRFS